MKTAIATFPHFDEYKAASRAHLAVVARHRELNDQCSATATDLAAKEDLEREIDTAAATLKHARAAYLSDPQPAPSAGPWWDAVAT